MGSKNKKQRKVESNEAKGSDGVAEDGKQMINDPRFSSAHTDPRFRRMPRRELKVAIDSRFKPVFSDKRFTMGSAPVDKRGKRRSGGSSNNSLREFYRIEEDDKKKKKKKDNNSEEESGDDSESEKETIDLKSEAESEEDSESEKKVTSLDEESVEEAESEEISEEDEEEDDTDEDVEAIYADDGPEIPVNCSTLIHMPCCSSSCYKFGDDDGL